MRDVTLSARERLAEARLYLCTDSRRDKGDLAEFLDAVLSHGVDIVQLREKGLEALDEIEILAVVGEACRRHGALLAVNDRADIARAVRADVLHLGQRDLPFEVARSIVGPDVVIGRSTHNPAQAALDIADPTFDYLCIGPTWPTPTKPGRPAAGIAATRAVARLFDDAKDPRPWFAIGGIDETTLDEVLDAGARRIVVVRALTEAEDPAGAAERLSARVRARADS